MNEPGLDSALESAYDTARTAAHDVAPYLARFARESDAARALLRYRTVRYGERDAEAIDLFPAAAGAPLFVFVHGGYWRRMTRSDFSFVAPPLVRAGVAVAVVGYPLAHAVDLDAIVGAVRLGVTRALEEAARDRIDVRRVTLGGHSVGAQLAAMVATERDASGLVGLSGLYDLEPLRATTINDAIAMDAASAARNAPIHHPPRRAATFLAAVGGRESIAFHDQTAAYARAWRTWGGSVETIALPQDDHFSLVLGLADPDRPLTRAVVRLAAGAGA